MPGGAFSPHQAPPKDRRPRCLARAAPLATVDCRSHVIDRYSRLADRHAAELGEGLQQQPDGPREVSRGAINRKPGGEPPALTLSLAGRCAQAVASWVDSART